ncbi:MAG TPA: hypothetical protein VFA18_12140, partial [Gemmataceae bacterium]|nr:hypothetical protein [Gemmataceae bacterium]
RRQRDTALQEQKQQLMQQGWLLAERGGLRGITSPMPWWCPSPDGRGFLVAWSSHADPGEAQLALERHGPPWSAGPATTPWTIAPHIYGLELSASGRYLAVAHAAGDWHATVWDLSEKRLVADVPQVRAVSSVGFLPDESAVYSVSSDGHTGRLVITPLDGTKARVFQLQHANRAVVHPSGAWLVVTDSYQRLFVVDLASGEVRLAGPVGGPSPWGSLGRLFTGRAGSAQSEGGAEGVFCLRFDPSGDCLCLGTMNGIRVLPWPEVRDADGTLPAPSLAVDVRGKTFAREGARGQFGGYIYDLEHDAKLNRLLFAGLEGRVRYLDLDTGLSGSLLEVPALPPIQRLSLSRDGMTLGLTCFPDMFSHSRNKRGPVLQFWSYETISSAQAPHGGAG